MTRIRLMYESIRRWAKSPGPTKGWSAAAYSLLGVTLILVQFQVADLNRDIIAGFTHELRQAEQDDYEACLLRVEGREAVLAANAQIWDVFAAIVMQDEDMDPETRAANLGAIGEFRAELPTALPPLDPADCVTSPAQTVD